jgi:hypothetical protein
METKTELIVKLYAGETLVDQSTDVGLWQRVLSEIRDISTSLESRKKADAPSEKESFLGDKSLKSYAKEIGVTGDELIGGLGPSSEAPFIYLDERCWEALKRNTPNRGPGAISPAVLAATALVTWAKHERDIGEVTIPAIKGVMTPANLDDPNTSRSINNCNWLQLRGGRVVLNPAQSSNAYRLLKAFCRKESLSGTS